MPILKCAEPVDPQWSKTLMEMDRDAKLVSLSSVEMQFLENVTLLEELKDVVVGCEVLEEYKLISSQEGFELWEKIKAFFADLWKKFVAWLKNIPNWFRPYINRAKDLKSRLGVTVKMDPIPQNILLPSAANFNAICSKIFGNPSAGVNPIIVDLYDFVPTICFGDKTPIRGKIVPFKFQQVSIADEDALIGWIDSAISFDELFDKLPVSLENSFNTQMEAWKIATPQNPDTPDPVAVVKAFQEDLSSIMELQKQILQMAKNLSAVKVSAK